MLIDWDHDALKWCVDTLRAGWLTPSMIFITNLNHNPLFWILAAAGVTFQVHRQPPGRRTRGVFVWVMLIVAIGIADLIEARVLKHGVGRLRPFLAYGDIKNLVPAGRFSFPSGHATNSFCIATFLSLAFPRKIVAVPAFSIAALIGFSRLYLGVHFPLDVFGGALLGAGIAWLVWKAMPAIERQFPMIAPPPRTSA